LASTAGFTTGFTAALIITAHASSHAFAAASPPWFVAA
jgi:hypothetical protein